METSSLITLPGLPSGRFGHALKMIASRVSEAGIPAVIEKVDQAREIAKETQLTELSWSEARRNTSSARGKAVLIDNMIDEQIAALEAGVRSMQVGDADDPVVEKAREFHSAIFSNGVRAITQQAFEVQEGIMKAMMVRFDSDLSEHVDLLGQRRSIERLRRLISEFSAELEQEKRDTVTFDQVRAARSALHEATCDVVVAILYHFSETDEASRRQRTRLLEPLLYQQARVAEARRRRRVPTDVNPDTGEELLPNAEPVMGDMEPEPAPEPAAF